MENITDLKTVSILLMLSLVLNVVLMLGAKKQDKWIAKHKSIEHQENAKIPYSSNEAFLYNHASGYYMTEDSVIHLPKAAANVVNFQIGNFSFADNGHQIEISSPDTSIFMERWFNILRINNNELQYSFDGINWFEL